MTQSILNNFEQKIKEIIKLYQNNYISKALLKSEELLKKEKKSHFLFNLNGMINISLKNWEKAITSLNQAINLNDKYLEAYNNLGVAYNNNGELQKAIDNFSISIKIKDNYANGYNNLGSVYDDLGKFDEAIDNYCKALKIDSKHIEAQTNLIHILTHYSTNKENSNPIIVSNNLLKKIKNNITPEKDIKKTDLANLFKSANKIIQNNVKELAFYETQIFRRNSINLNCERHHKAFNEFNIIPKFCFSCFKVQIEPKNILELFKLFFIFDKLELPKNNTRKCTVELRPKVSGIYKGLVYCSSVDEAKEILQILSPFLEKFIKGKVKIRRGCSEFAESFSKYKEIDKNNPNFMEYNEEWKSKEKIVDSHEAKNKKGRKIFRDTLKGLSISDILVMNNWLNYARKIDDYSYKDISEDMFYSEYISKTISEQLEKRKNEFLVI